MNRRQTTPQIFSLGTGRPYMYGCLDAKSAASGAPTSIMGLWVKVKISVQPLDVLL